MRASPPLVANSRGDERRSMSSAAKGPARWRAPKPVLAAALIAFIGVLLFLYPTIAAWVSQYNQSQLIHTYSGEVHDLDAAFRETSLAQAHAYNQALTGGASVAAGARLPRADSPQLPGDFAYDQLLRIDSTGLMARLKIPSISVDLPVYHGTSDATLLRGVGHLEGTALPVGGDSTHAVLTAHRGLASAELFTHLDEVEVGQTFTIEVFGEVLSYRVIETTVVEPDQTQSLFPQLGRDLVTLVTCTPLGINSHRILVTGERLLPTPAADLQQAGAIPDIPGPPWWALGILATAGVLGGYVWRMGLGRLPTELQAEPQPEHPGPAEAEEQDQ